MPADPAPGRLDPGQAASRGRHANRAAGIAAEGAVTEACRHADAGARRGDAGPKARFPRIVRALIHRMVIERRRLGHVRLADDNGARALQACDDRRVGGGHAVFHDLGASRRGYARDIDQILDTDRDAVHRAAPLPPAEFGIGSHRIRQGRVAHHAQKAVEAGLEGRDPGKQCGDDLDAGEIAAPDALRDVKETQIMQIGLHGRIVTARRLSCPQPRAISALSRRIKTPLGTEPYLAARVRAIPWELCDA